MVEGSITFGSPRFPLLESHQQLHGEEDEASPVVDPLPPAPAFWHRAQRRDAHTDLSACTDTPLRAPIGGHLCAQTWRDVWKSYIE